MDIEKELTRIESDFADFKSKKENTYVLLIILFLMPFTASLIFFSRYYQAIFSLLAVRTAIFCLLLILAGGYVLIRRTFLKSNNAYRSFIRHQLDVLAEDYSGTDFEKALFEEAVRQKGHLNPDFYLNLERVINQTVKDV